MAEVEGSWLGGANNKIYWSFTKHCVVLYSIYHIIIGTQWTAGVAAWLPAYYTISYKLSTKVLQFVQSYVSDDTICISD